MRISPVSFRASTRLLEMAAMSATACVDTVSSPMAALMAEETRAVLDLGQALPSLTDLWSASGGGIDEGPVARWEGSWELPTREGRALRSLIYEDAVPVLCGRLGEDQLETLLIDMDSTLARVDHLSAIGIPEWVSRRLDSASDRLTTAWILAAEGEGVSSLAAALEVSDYLLEVTPPHVAAQLLTSAERGVGRIPPEDSYSEEMLGRIVAASTVDGAASSASEGDSCFVRADFLAYVKSVGRSVRLRGRRERCRGYSRP